MRSRLVGVPHLLGRSGVRVTQPERIQFAQAQHEANIHAQILRRAKASRQCGHLLDRVEFGPAARPKALALQLGDLIRHPASNFRQRVHARSFEVGQQLSGHIEAGAEFFVGSHAAQILQRQFETVAELRQIECRGRFGHSEYILRRQIEDLRQIQIQPAGGNPDGGVFPGQVEKQLVAVNCFLPLALAGEFQRGSGQVSRNIEKGCQLLNNVFILLRQRFGQFGGDVKIKYLLLAQIARFDWRVADGRRRDF